MGDAALERRKLADEGRPIKTKDMIMAFAPYLIIIIVLGITSITAVHLQLDKATSAFKWPGLNVLNSKGKVPRARPSR